MAKGDYQITPGTFEENALKQLVGDMKKVLEKLDEISKKLDQRAF